MSNFISPAIHCQLGNNLFQIAQAYAQSLKHHRPMVTFTGNRWVKDGNPHLPQFRDNVLRNIKFIDGGPTDDYQEVETPQWTDEEVSPKEENTIFYGQPQCEKHFKAYSNEVKELFGPTDEFILKMNEKYPMLKSGKVTSIQVRRGDGHMNQLSRHPTVSVDYVVNTAKMIPSDYYFVFSNDVEWCKQSIKLDNCVIVDEDAPTTLWLMSLCHNFSIANSTFGWWGAYLSQAPNKIVCMPKCWFGPQFYLTVVGATDSYLPAKGWKVVPSEYKNGFIIPV
jgi:hypothetical protein